MKIYGFYYDVWGYKKERLHISEIEVEEKPKSYISKERHTRISKSDINVLNGHRMYCLDKNPEPFLDAICELFQKKVNRAKQNLQNLEANLAEATSLSRNIKNNKLF